MSVPKKSFLGRPAPATARAPSASASPSRPSPRPAVTTTNPGPGQTWFNLTRKDVEKMSWAQLQRKAGDNHQQPAPPDRKSVWQRLASLFSGSDNE